MATMTKFNNQIMQFAYSAVSSGLLADVYDRAVPPTTDNIDLTSPVSIASRVIPYADRTIIVFKSSPTTLIKENLEGDLVDFPNTNFQQFEFICTKKNPSVSINKTVLDQFVLIKAQLDELKDVIKAKLDKHNDAIAERRKKKLATGDQKSPLIIITGISLGGSIASLFTLWLLDTIYLKESRKPLCITFGSPLVGNDAFQKAISERPTWISSFLSVISKKDPVPRILAFGDYMPFGTTLLLSESGCACFDEPRSILDLIKATSLENQVGSDNCDYGVTLKRIQRNVIRKPKENVKCDINNPLQAGITLQLLDIGATNKQEINKGKSSLITKIEERLETIQKQKISVYDQKKSLSKLKVSMVHMEKYKKDAENGGGCYYDNYKTVFTKSREDIVKSQRVLTQYWERMVDEIEKMPKREAANKILSRWLYGGTNYRRMVEPLVIAEYYMVEGNTDYIKNKRSQHFKLLDEWDQDYQRYKPDERRTKVASLTEDSCFWAHVEEALIVLKSMNGDDDDDKDVLIGRLVEFEAYVMGLIKKLAVSVEIFNEKSSFMKWWCKYKEIKTTSYNSELMAFMNNEKLDNGCLTLDEYKKRI